MMMNIWHVYAMGKEGVVQGEAKTKTASREGAESTKFMECAKVLEEDISSMQSRDARDGLRKHRAVTESCCGAIE